MSLRPCNSHIDTYVVHIGVCHSLVDNIINIKGNKIIKNCAAVVWLSCVWLAHSVIFYHKWLYQCLWTRYLSKTKTFLFLYLFIYSFIPLFRYFALFNYNRTNMRHFWFIFLMEQWAVCLRLPHSRIVDACGIPTSRMLFM